LARFVEKKGAQALLSPHDRPIAGKRGGRYRRAVKTNAVQKRRGQADLKRLVAPIAAPV
jgi:hypothetical protein